MTTAIEKPTRREQRRIQTLQEIKALAMEQVAAGGPDAVSLSGIVRSMSMSPAAVYRYFDSRDALLGDLVVDAYDEFADFIAQSSSDDVVPEERLAAVLHAVRIWALDHPNAYRLIFQTSVGSGNEVAPERTRSASTRSMSTIVAVLAAAGSRSSAAKPSDQVPAEVSDEVPQSPFVDAVAGWAKRSGLDAYGPAVLALGMTTWTRLHGVISLELGGHLGATGLDPSALYDAEVADIGRAAGRIAT
ncbi:TetR/AcrR family transcriptional regulator [Naasia lichenicola]|uniref:TetR/AcrR family transcriptional regulator n=1 Tax=Naasia lichenicola TaxID=2565933 RepID=UPI00130E7672|nr:TetR/AcrR family transcriptional regulator [Naasia lichenicola]